MNRLICAGLVAFTVACGGDDEGPSNNADAGPLLGGVSAVSCSGATIAVTFTTPGNRFEPMSSTIDRGEVVRFDPATGHDVASLQGGLFNVSLGGEGCFRFDDPGTFRFRCNPHGFTGTLVVQ